MSLFPSLQLPLPPVPLPITTPPSPPPLCELFTAHSLVDPVYHLPWRRADHDLYAASKVAEDDRLVAVAAAQEDTAHRRERADSEFASDDAERRSIATLEQTITNSAAEQRNAIVNECRRRRMELDQRIRQRREIEEARLIAVKAAAARDDADYWNVHEETYHLATEALIICLPDTPTGANSFTAATDLLMAAMKTATRVERARIDRLRREQTANAVRRHSRVKLHLLSLLFALPTTANLNDFSSLARLSQYQSAHAVELNSHLLHIVAAIEEARVQRRQEDDRRRGWFGRWNILSTPTLMDADEAREKVESFWTDSGGPVVEVYDYGDINAHYDRLLSSLMRDCETHRVFPQYYESSVVTLSVAAQQIVDVFAFLYGVTRVHQTNGALNILVQSPHISLEYHRLLISQVELLLSATASYSFTRLDDARLIRSFELAIIFAAQCIVIYRAILATFTIVPPIEQAESAKTKADVEVDDLAVDTAVNVHVVVSANIPVESPSPQKALTITFRANESVGETIVRLSAQVLRTCWRRVAPSKEKAQTQQNDIEVDTILQSYVRRISRQAFVHRFIFFLNSVVGAERANSAFYCLPSSADVLSPPPPELSTITQLRQLIRVLTDDVIAEREFSETLLSQLCPSMHRWAHDEYVTMLLVQAQDVITRAGAGQLESVVDDDVISVYPLMMDLITINGDPISPQYSDDIVDWFEPVSSRFIKAACLSIDNTPANVGDINRMAADIRSSLPELTRAPLSQHHKDDLRSSLLAFLSRTMTESRSHMTTEPLTLSNGDISSSLHEELNRIRHFTDVAYDVRHALPPATIVSSADDEFTSALVDPLNTITSSYVKDSAAEIHTALWERPIDREWNEDDARRAVASLTKSAYAGIERIMTSSLEHAMVVLMTTLMLSHIMNTLTDELLNRSPLVEPAQRSVQTMMGRAQGRRAALIYALIIHTFSGALPNMTAPQRFSGREDIALSDVVSALRDATSSPTATKPATAPLKIEFDQFAIAIVRPTWIIRAFTETTPNLVLTAQAIAKHTAINNTILLPSADTLTPNTSMSGSRVSSFSSTSPHMISGVRDNSRFDEIEWCMSRYRLPPNMFVDILSQRAEFDLDAAAAAGVKHIAARDHKIRRVTAAAAYLE